MRDAWLRVWLRMKESIHAEMWFYIISEISAAESMMKGSEKSAFKPVSTVQQGEDHHWRWIPKYVPIRSDAQGLVQCQRLFVEVLRVLSRLA